MKKVGIGLVCLAYCLGIVGASSIVRAQTITEPLVELANPVIITELQTASYASGKSDEFIEVYNTSDKALDISGWQLSYLNASSAADVKPTLVVRINPNTILAAHSYFVARTDTVPLLASTLTQTYSAKLSNADKVIALFAPDKETCEYSVQDAIAWGTSTKAEGVAVPASGSTERWVQRLRSKQQYVDTDNNAHDFALSAASVTTIGSPHVTKGATPGLDNTGVLSANVLPPAVVSLPDFSVLKVDDCVVPPPPEPEPEAIKVIPTGGGTTAPTLDPPASDTTKELQPDAASPISSSLLPLQITELLPNPAPPISDETGEYIELFNPNNEAMDLRGYKLQSGSNLSYSYTFNETTIAANSYLAFYVGDTHLLLANSAGKARLSDPTGLVISETTPYVDARDGEAWALLNSSWQWTTTPTPAALNALGAPIVPLVKSVAPKSTTKVVVKPKAVAKPKVAAAAKTTKPKAVAAERATYNQPATINQTSPLHPSVLALVLGGALLYGLYEYRQDITNRLYQLRRYRAVRRSARPTT